MLLDNSCVNNIGGLMVVKGWTVTVAYVLQCGAYAAVLTGYILVSFYKGIVYVSTAELEAKQKFLEIMEVNHGIVGITVSILGIKKHGNLVFIAIYFHCRMGSALLSRFDLVFILLDKPDEELDARLSEHVMALHVGGSR